MDQERMLAFIEEVDRDRIAVFKPRNESYSRESKSNGLSNFTDTADILKLLGIEMSGEEFAISMVVLKLVRDANMRKKGMPSHDPQRRDNLVDAHNYLDLAMMNALEEEEKRSNY